MSEHLSERGDETVKDGLKKATHGNSGTVQHTRFALGDQVDVITIPGEDDISPARNSSGAEKELPTGVRKTDSEESFHSWAGMRPLSIKDTVSRLRELQRDKKPLSFCKLIVNYPKTALAVTLSVHVGMLLTNLILYLVGYDILPMHFTSLPLDIRTDIDFLQGLAWVHKDEKTKFVNQMVDRVSKQPERSKIAEGIELYFEKPGGNVFTQENLRKMREVTYLLSKHPKYVKSFCLSKVVGKCEQPYSVFTFFDKYEETVPSSNASNFVDIPTVMTQLMQYRPAALQRFLGKDSVISLNDTHSAITRVILLFGKPLAGYHNAYISSEAQDKKIEEFILAEFKPVLERLFSSQVGEMKFFYNSVSLFLNKIDTQVMADLKLAVGSLCFIFVFMLMQTGSVWVTCLAMLSVVTSFCGANLFYRVVLDYRYFGAFHVLAVFIILAVGADDTFVFFDTWKLTRHFFYPTLAHRLSNCYRKAGLAMFFTSVTTAVAFGLSAISPFLGISSFGVFSALLVIINYVSVVTYFPAVVITYHLYWESATCLCCRIIKERDDDDDDDQGNANDDSKNSFSEMAFMSGHPAMRFFRGPFFHFITNKYSRILILGAFCVLIPFSFYYSSLLTSDEEKMKFLSKESNFAIYLNKREKAFKGLGARTSHVFIVWGLQKQTLRSCHNTNITCHGDTVWEKDFDMNPPASQKAIVHLCDALKLLLEEETKQLGVRTHIRSNEKEFDCFIQDISHFLQEEEKRMRVDPKTKKKVRVYPNNTVFNFPIGKHEAEIIMKYNPHIYKKPLPKWFNRYFEIVMGFWLHNGFRPGQENDRYKRYFPLLGEVAVPGTTVAVRVKRAGKGSSHKMFYYGTRLAYAAISVNMSISGDNLNYILGIDMLHNWNKLISIQKASMPPQLQKGFHVALGPKEGDGTIMNIWHWMKVQEQLTNSAFIGIIVGLCTALPILVWATKNVIVALLALITIIFITFSVVAVIPIMNWKLGVLESLNLVLLVGLAVEFVIHLSEAYARSEHRGRLGRTQDALSEVGFSVLSGAFSSLGASFFLLLAKIVFLVEFGVFMFCTVGFSIVYSLLLFTTVLGMIGPERRFGNVSTVKAYLRQRWNTRTMNKHRVARATMTSDWTDDGEMRASLPAGK